MVHYAADVVVLRRDPHLIFHLASARVTLMDGHPCMSRAYAPACRLLGQSFCTTPCSSHSVNNACMPNFEHAGRVAFLSQVASDRYLWLLYDTCAGAPAPSKSTPTLQYVLPAHRLALSCPGGNSRRGTQLSGSESHARTQNFSAYEPEAYHIQPKVKRLCP